MTRGLDMQLSRIEALMQALRLEEAEALCRALLDRLSGPDRDQEHSSDPASPLLPSPSSSPSDLIWGPLPNPCKDAQIKSVHNAQGAENPQDGADQSHSQRQNPSYILGMLHFYTGSLAANRGELWDAESHLVEASGLCPNVPNILNNLAVTYRRLGDEARAVETYQHLLRLVPLHLEALEFVADALLDRKQLSTAAELYARLAQINPVSFKVNNNLCFILTRLGHSAAAIVFGEKAVTLARDAETSMAYHNLGRAYSEVSLPQKAQSAFLEAYNRNPENSALLADIASNYFNCGDLKNSLGFFQKSFALQNDVYSASYIFYQKRLLVNWSDLSIYEEYINMTINEQNRPIGHFPILLLGISKNQFLKNAINTSSLYSQSLAPLASVAASVKQQGRIRIGYLSNDFCEHATAYLLAGVLEAHDRSGFEIHLYSWGTPSALPMRARLAAAADRFVDLTGLDNAAAACRIRDDALDILIDLKGYTQGARPEILAFRPCSLQINYLGFPGTMGADFIDYIVADSYVIPEGHEAYYSEKVIRLPHCYQANDDKRVIASPPTRADCGLPGEAFVLCAFHQAYKISPDMFTVWVQLLKAIPDSVLWLLAGHSPEVEENLRSEARQRGLAPERLVFAPPLPQTEHLARMQLADLALDTWPVGGHTTASDALWAGLPYIALTGEAFASRVAGSLLTTLGLPELIAYSVEDYRALVLDLALNRARLSAVRTRLAEARHTSPLFDTVRFTRNLESAYRQILENQGIGNPPAHRMVREEV